MTDARAIERFPQRSGIGVVVDHRGDSEHLVKVISQREPVPPADVSREGDALRGEIHRSSEADAASG
jgi:hypothetical protein